MSSVKGLPLRSGGGGFRWWFISCLSGVINVWRCDLRLLTSKARARLYLGMIKAGSVCSPVDTGKGSVSSQLIYIVFLGCVLSGQVPNFFFIYLFFGWTWRVLTVAFLCGFKQHFNEYKMQETSRTGHDLTIWTIELHKLIMIGNNFVFHPVQKEIGVAVVSCCQLQFCYGPN